MKKSTIFRFIAVIVSICYLVYPLFFGKNITINDFLNTLEKDNRYFSKIIVNDYDNYLYLYPRNDNFYDMYYQTFRISSHGNFHNDIINKISNDTSLIFTSSQSIVSVLNSIISYYMFYGVGVLIFFLVIYYLFCTYISPLFSMTGSNVNKSLDKFPFFESIKFQVIEPGSIDSSFDKVVGQNEAKDDLVECMNFFKYREDYLSMGYKIPKGLLFTGPPGTGKTLLARAFASETNISFIPANGTDFVAMFVGLGAKNVRELFDIARKNAPAIVFIDELDSIGRKRGTDMTSSENDNTLNALLAEIDGFKPNDNIMIIGTTNFPEALDPALLRSGRFDKEIIFELPNKEEREQLFKSYLSGIKLDSEFDIDIESKKLANLTAGASGADIANIANQSISIFMKRIKFGAFCEKNMESNPMYYSSNDINALMIKLDKINKNQIVDETIVNQPVDAKLIEDTLVESLNTETPVKIDDQPIKNDDESNDYSNEEPRYKTFDQKLGVTYPDIEKALDIVLVGMEKRERTMTDEEKKIVAYHEAGHALIAYLLNNTLPPIKISIIPRGRSALGFTMQERDDTKIYTIAHLINRIAVLLGGRSAELIVFNHLSTGAADDIEKITSLSYDIITKYGMGCYGPINLKKNKVSNETQNRVDKDRTNLIRSIEIQVIDILKNNMDILKILADELYLKEVMTSGEINTLLESLDVKMNSFNIEL